MTRPKSRARCDDRVAAHLRLPDDQVLVAHMPQDEVNGAKLGDIVAVDLRRPKTFRREDTGQAPSPESAATA